MIRTAVLGYGVVGKGTVDIINAKREQLKSKTGQDIDVKYILVRHDYDSDCKEKFVYDFETILNDSDVNIVIEAIGGKHPAYEYIKSALSAGKSVVTSNKELVAAYGAELMAVAKEKNVNFMFEAAVGGAVPIIHGVRNCFEASEINGIYGILNGTTNYILTKMIQENLSFDVALKQAQELGYAEADPSGDVDGIDTCRKICILTDIVTKQRILPENVHTEGIRGIRKEDVAILAPLGYGIKLLGCYKKLTEGKISVITAPFAVSNDCILSSANDVFNRVLLDTDNAGQSAFYGRGAGSLPTGNAVVNDVAECVKAGGTIYDGWREKDIKIINYNEIVYDFYVNIDGKEDISAHFADAEQVYSGTEKAYIVKSVTEKELSDKLKGVKVNSYLRILECKN